MANGKDYTQYMASGVYHPPKTYTTSEDGDMYYTETITNTPIPTKEERELKLEQQIVEYGAVVTSLKVKIEKQDKEHLRLATLVTRQDTILKKLRQKTTEKLGKGKIYTDDKIQQYCEVTELKARLGELEAQRDKAKADIGSLDVGIRKLALEVFPSETIDSLDKYATLEILRSIGKKAKKAPKYHDI
tara:strand:- start:30083 stop:30646 length:564 start_codon:yes stop_codon:yes gene_type:complete